MRCSRSGYGRACATSPAPSSASPRPTWTTSAVIEIMERVTFTVPGAVSVTGRVLGGELFVEHAQRGARRKWQFIFAVATDGSSRSALLPLSATGGRYPAG